MQSSQEMKQIHSRKGNRKYRVESFRKKSQPMVSHIFSYLSQIKFSIDLITSDLSRSKYQYD